MDIQVDTLLIIGNGFDLHCGLKSGFSHYFDCECKNVLGELYSYYFYGCYSKFYNLLVNNDNIINFWSFLFYIHFFAQNEKYKIEEVVGDRWFDIEELIKSYLSYKFFGNRYLTDYVKIGLTKEKINLLLFETDKSLCRDIKDNPYILFSYFQSNTTDNPYEYLENELHKFERSFKDYLLKQINEEYNKNCFAFLKTLLEESDYVDVLNSNYTTLKDNGMLINKQINVHGKLNGDEGIIIGIDYKDADDNKMVRFTKTYRNLHKIKEGFLMPSNIKSIVFYGHSLADSDFSYFYSLFDMYGLYNGGLKLKFLYSDYEDDKYKNENNHKKYVDQIYSLINKYSMESKKESNLLHRLILESRISIKKI